MGRASVIPQSVLTAQREAQRPTPSAKSSVSPSISPQSAVDASQPPLMTSPSTWQYFQPTSPLGTIFCLNAKNPKAKVLIEAVAAALSSTLALLLQQQWLRRDRFKRMLQLELHRTVFQVSLDCLV